LSDKIMWKLHQKIFIWLCAIGLNIKGLLCIYIFLSLKHYHSQYLLPVGVFAILLSLGLYPIWTPCIILLVIGALGTLILSGYVQVSSHLFSPYLTVIAVISLLVLFMITPTLMKHSFKSLFKPEKC
jgi:hypothetical protein